MFRNLEAEQARFGYTNQQTANKLGISRTSYENKKKTGKFTALEAKNYVKFLSQSLIICSKQKNRKEVGE